MVYWYLYYYDLFLSYRWKLGLSRKFGERGCLEFYGKLGLRLEFFFSFVGVIYLFFCDFDVEFRYVVFLDNVFIIEIYVLVSVFRVG